MPGVAFFVCGTPSNNRGFELVDLGPERLPGTPETYLDKAPADAVESHRIESILIDGQRYVEYSRVLRINPNDAEANRGAYLAVGCLIGQRVAFHTVSNCVDVVSELYGNVCGELTADRSFPVGYRLADFTHHLSPLDERTAHQCSPLLVSDVVLQALNGEGPIDWLNTRQLLLAPGEMLAADVGRYRFYSGQGSLGSLASIDLERAQLQHTARQTGMAAGVVAELEDEWTALQAAAERLITKGESLRHLTAELERTVERDLSLDGAAARGSLTEAQKGAPTLDDAGRAPYERAYRTRPTGNVPAAAIGSQARLGRQRAVRSRSVVRQGHWLRGSGWAGVSAMVLIGILVALLAVVAVQRFVLPELGVEVASPPAVVMEPERQNDQEPEQPQNDVARERAALDALPDD